MRGGIVFLIGILLAGCGERTNFGPTPPEAYLDWRDRMVVRFGRPMLGRIAPCWTETYDDIPTDECVKMTEPRRWRGLWRIDFEITRFCPAPARVCDYGTPGTSIWTVGSPGVRLPEGGLYAVEMVGRRTVYPGQFGHLNDYDHELIVDQVISIREIEK